VSLFFAVEAQVASHELRFLGFRVLSSASGSIDVRGDCGVDVHVVSSLRGGASVVSIPPVVVSSETASSWVVGPRREFECLEESLTSLGELGCRLPFKVRLASLFFPLFECPRDVCGRVEVGGINDGASKAFIHGVLEGFDSSLVI